VASTQNRCPPQSGVAIVLTFLPFSWTAGLSNLSPHTILGSAPRIFTHLHFIVENRRAKSHLPFLLYILHRKSKYTCTRLPLKFTKFGPISSTSHSCSLFLSLKKFAIMFGQGASYLLSSLSFFPSSHDDLYNSRFFSILLHNVHVVLLTWYDTFSDQKKRPAALDLAPSRKSSTDSSNSSLKPPRTPRFAEATSVHSPIDGPSPFADPPAMTSQAPQSQVADVGFGYIGNDGQQGQSVAVPMTPRSPLKSAMRVPGTPARKLENPMSPTFREEEMLEKRELTTDKQQKRDLVSILLLKCEFPTRKIS
jgi:hypothetical protein